MVLRHADEEGFNSADSVTESFIKQNLPKEVRPTLGFEEQVGVF